MAKKNIVVLTKIPELHDVIKSIGVDAKGDVQRLVTGECFKRVKGYMPRMSGELADVLTSIEDDSHIKTEGPYARFLFFGVTSSGLPIEYSRSANPNAGPHWDRRLAAAEGAAIAAKAQEFVDGKARRHGR